MYVCLIQRDGLSSTTLGAFIQITIIVGMLDSSAYSAKKQKGFTLSAQK